MDQLQLNPKTGQYYAKKPLVKMSLGQFLGIGFFAFLCLVWIANGGQTGTPATTNLDPVSFNDMVYKTGCKSSYSDERKADIYRKEFEGHPTTVRGMIETLDNGSIGLKVFPDTLTYDVMVQTKNKSDTYRLLKGSFVTVTFNISFHGGCVLSYSGENGVVQ